MRKRNQGFTLVELLIAVALMVILTGSIVFVFTQAQRVYVNTDAAVKVYQNVRAAMDTLDRDISGAYRTIDMEFWGPDAQDPNSKQYNGHLDLNTEKYQVNKSPQFNASIPTEFKVIKDFRMVDTMDYIYSMLIKQSEYTDALDNKIIHAADEIYLKTETPIPSKGNISRTALVKYSLRLPPKGTELSRAPILMKWVMWFDKTNPANPFVVAEMPQPLCYFVLDFRVEIYIRNKRTNSPGKFYTVDEAQKAGFYSPVTISGGDKVFSPMFMRIREKRNGGTSTDNTLRGLAGYDSSDSTNPKGKFVRVLSGEPYFSLLANANSPTFFYQLDKGDKIFLYDPDVAGQNNYMIPPAEYTIKDIRKDSPSGTEWKVYFREAVDTTQLDRANLPSTEMSFRAAWLPAAIRVTLKVVDSKSLGPNQVSRTVVRVFKVLGS